MHQRRPLNYNRIVKEGLTFVDDHVDKLFERERGKDI